MVKEIKTKRTIRQELEEEINRFLNTGGKIEHVEKGVSGKEIGVNLNQSTMTFEGNGQQTRTPLTDEIKALEARKNKKSVQPATPTNKPRKRIIYDDFGEPLREIWE